MVVTAAKQVKAALQMVTEVMAAQEVKEAPLRVVLGRVVELQEMFYRLEEACRKEAMAVTEVMVVTAVQAAQQMAAQTGLRVQTGFRAPEETMELTDLH
jgi:hypothetical protein